MTEYERALNLPLALTADHGNAEFVAHPATGQPHTAHTHSPTTTHLLTTTIPVIPSFSCGKHKYL
jgi:bisphosphoglycerate-independent phosphoglycerate mutase (AlkP superfamily)